MVDSGRSAEAVLMSIACALGEDAYTAPPMLPRLSSRPSDESSDDVEAPPREPSGSEVSLASVSSCLVMESG
jgi:hypothetical protein